MSGLGSRKRLKTNVNCLKAELKAISDDDSDVEEIKDQLKKWSKIHKEAKSKVIELEKQQQVPMVPIDLDSGVGLEEDVFDEVNE